MLSWRRLLLQEVRFAFSLARLRAGRSIAARMAMIAITTKSSINVKASEERRGRDFAEFLDEEIGELWLAQRFMFDGFLMRL